MSIITTNKQKYTFQEYENIENDGQEATELLDNNDETTDHQSDVETFNDH